MDNIFTAQQQRTIDEYTIPTDHFYSGALGVYSETYEQYIITNSGHIFAVGDRYKNIEYKYADSQNDELIGGVNITTNHPERGTMIGIIVVQKMRNGFTENPTTHITVTTYMAEIGERD